MGKKVLIVGSGSAGLTAARKVELMAKNLSMEVVTIEEAKERGLNQTFDVVSQPPLLKVSAPPLTRAERRKKIRKNNKIE